jgi:hypothetical protein
MMFKNFSGGATATAAGPGKLPNHCTPQFLRFLVVVALVLGSGCATVFHKLPAVNLQEPGWTVRQGQAVWHLGKGQGGREFAGDVLVATRAAGRAFVQFSKPPFPLVIAQENQRQWQVEFPPQNKHYAGRGRPPQRIIWLYLPRVLLGQAPPEDWIWHQDQSGWRLEDYRNGEYIEGFFNSNGAMGRSLGEHLALAARSPVRPP